MSALAPLLGAKRTVSPKGRALPRRAAAASSLALSCHACHAHELCPAARAQAVSQTTEPAARPQARGKQFSDRPKYFIAVVTNPARLTLQSYDSNAALQSGTSHPTGGMLKMLNTILLAIMLTILGIAISPPGSYHRIFIWRIIIGACVVGTAVVASTG